MRCSGLIGSLNYAMVTCGWATVRRRQSGAPLPHPAMGVIPRLPSRRQTLTIALSMRSLHKAILTAAAISPQLCATTMIASTFGDDAAFLQKHTPLVILSDSAGQAKVALAPAWQGRVMTSTSGGDTGLS